ncbi:MAG: hypothetical protein GY861_24415 [bacterium]|nr:hypothetical protein [bacterium]
MELIGTFPVTENPEESFSIVLLGELYNIRQLWNTLGFWTIDIFDSDGTILVHGIKIVSGIFFVKQYPHIPWDLYIDEIIDPERFTLSSMVIGVYEK